MSQSVLAAAADISGSYLSLIESGRRPVGAGLLAKFAQELGCSVDHLRTGRGASADNSAEVELRFAEMALRSGDSDTARERFEAVLAQAAELRRPDLAADARWGVARAKEAQGLLEESIVDLEAVAADDKLPAGVTQMALDTRLCRTYSECGDLNHAIEIGEAALRRVEEEAADELASDDAVALASTLVGCYYERGDLTRAHTLAAEWIRRADEGGSPLARAAALWNAGLVAEARGDIRSATRFLDRALALYSESDNARATSILKVAAAWVILRSPEPNLPEAERHLVQAIDELTINGSSVDVAYAEVELARCRRLQGDAAAAGELAEAALDRLGVHPRLERAQALLVMGHARFDQGDGETAVAMYGLAAADLRSAGADRQAATAWRELAEALAGLGRADEALEAYRLAADSAGVRKSPEVAAASVTRSSAARR